jgi:hypothetical protein
MASDDPLASLNSPRVIFFFPNGTAAVCDGHGRQMPRYQRGWHGTTVARLEADGIDWRSIPERHGSPMATPPSWWDARREAMMAEGEAAEGAGG